MTSSLVGSEMCIRDRLDAGQLQAALPTDWAVVDFPFYPGASDSWCFTCLLYTSELPTICSV
eukprot:6888802-Prorocentrum_lima.AAC.1